MSVHRCDFALRALILAVLCAMAAPALAADEKKPFEPPTPETVKKVLDKYYRQEWGKDWGNAKVETLTIDITEPKIGKLMEKQMGRGQLARPVYPVKTVVKIVVKYVGNSKPKEQIIGAGEGDAFFFYKDAFDEWTWRTGSL